jgi:hypothetical protein
LTEVSHYILDSLILSSIMDFLVPPDVTAELTQILSNLVLGDNEIRSKYLPLSHPIPLPSPTLSAQKPSSTSA